MDLLLSASIVSAFIAGIAALFAPCCLTVLLPSYFASVFRERHRVFVMTFIFFLGILIVFLPIGLGVGALGQLLSQYHNPVFAFGGLFLVILGLTLLTGRHLSLPITVTPYLKDHNAFSILTLGIFSGIATTCCAPVLAGVLALATLPGSVVWGGIYTLSYVFGMVAPLFLLSLVLDRANLSQKLSRIFHKPIEYSVGPVRIGVSVSEMVSGITFLSMGALIFYLALTNKLLVHSEFQTDLNILVIRALSLINDPVRLVPEYVWALLLLAVIAIVVMVSVSQLRRERREP